MNSFLPGSSPSYNADNFCEADLADELFVLVFGSSYPCWIPSYDEAPGGM